MSRNTPVSKKAASAIVSAKELRKKAKLTEREAAWLRLIEAESKALAVPGWRVGELMKAVAQRCGKRTTAISIAKSERYYHDNSPATLNKIADEYLKLAAEKQAENEIISAQRNSGEAVAVLEFTTTAKHD